jgi:predicted O-methyltransferase YrrM
MITDRISVLEMAAAENPRGVAVEVGVAGGHFTKQILATWPTCSRLYAVDCWGAFEGNHLSNDQQEQRFQEVTRDFSKHKNVTIVRKYSHVAAADIPNGSVDFIYIDADHSHAAALRDLQSWFPKLKKKGIMAGHDYYNGCGVKSAVDEFGAKNRLAVHSTTAEYSRKSAVYGPGWEGPSFYFRKP